MTAPEPPAIPGATSRFVEAGGVRLHLVEAGRGPLVLLLHGFPHFSWTWRHQLPALAEGGFRAVALDLRGYGRSERPRGVSPYALGRLAADVDEVIAALGVERAAAVAGHDWGGAIAWRAAERYPARVERLAILNAPHPSALARGLLRGAQALRSSYMLAFVVPGLAERALAARDGALLRRALRASRATPVADAELEPYVEMARAAEWLRGGLAMYRAMGLSLARRALRRAPLPGRAAERDGAAAPPRIRAPVLVVWGPRDPFLAPHLAEPPRGVASDVRVEWIADASHDVMLDAPARVSALLLEHLRRPA